jgi:hypothetical protein
MQDHLLLGVVLLSIRVPEILAAVDELTGPLIM